MWRTISIITIVSVATWALLMVLLSVLSRRAVPGGLHEGRLAAPPGSPNCVSSQTEGASHVEPLTFKGDPDEAWQRLKRTLAARPRTQFVEETDDYLHAECRSWLFRFIDDVECLLDREHHCIHVRSAARVGWWDLGVNRRRVEAIRTAFREQ